MRKGILIILTLSLSTLLSAQVTVDNTSQTVADAVQSSLIGEGVDVFNYMINGQPGNQIQLQAGTFSDANSATGISSGFIMGTGYVTLAAQPNLTGSEEDPGFPGVPIQYSDPDLEALTSVSVNDQCVIEFDFIPQGDTLLFEYVFASEEYPEFGCSTFNDVFGFFISGNNPDGGVYINENIALIPDPDNPGEYTDIPVAINSINDGNNGTPENCEEIAPNYLDYVQYYVSNEEGTDYEYDGRTVVLTARAIVNCGEQYHIKLAIGDGGDNAYDSAVFFKANSFSAEPTGITASSLFPLGLVEISDNCDEGFARIGRPCGADTAYYQLTYLVNDSTAEYGVDYEPLPTEIMLPTGVTDSVFPIITIPDTLTEDLEYICIELQEAFSEDGPYAVIDTVCLPIVDNYTFDVAINDVPLYCPEAVPVFVANPQFPAVAPYDFEYYLNGTLVADSNNYIPDIPAQWDSVTYTLVVQDFCGAFNNFTDVLVANLVPSYPTVSIGTVGEYCPGLGYDLSANRNGGTGPITYTWTDEFFVTYDDAQTITVDPQVLYPQETSMDFHLLLEDNCNPSRTAEADITVTYPTPIEVSTSMNDVVCVGQELELSVNASGGYPPYGYSWSSQPPLLPGSEFPSPDGFATQPSNGEGIAYGFYVTDEMSELAFDMTLRVNDWCSDSLNALAVFPNYHPSAVDVDTVEALNCIYPNVVSPNEDGMNDAFVINEMINRPGTMFIYNRWGNLLAETNRHQWNIDNEPAGTYFYVVHFEDGEEKKGYFTVIR
jgi:gliding motility-associated-like protein